MKLTNKDILCVLYTAKLKFITDRSKEFITDRSTDDYAFSMCFYIQTCINFIFNTYIRYVEIKNIIPEFIPKTFGLNINYNHFWWDVDDINSRINAFDKLIKIYKNKINGNI